MGSEEEKRKRITDFYKGEVKAEKGKKARLELHEIIGLSDKVGLALSRGVSQSTATLATVVIDYLNLSREERKSAEKVIGRAINGGKEGDLEALRTLIFLVAHQIKSQSKWWWIPPAALAVAIVSALVASVSLIVSLSR